MDDGIERWMRDFQRQQAEFERSRDRLLEMSPSTYFKSLTEMVDSFTATQRVLERMDAEHQRMLDAVGLRPSEALAHQLARTLELENATLRRFLLADQLQAGVSLAIEQERLARQSQALFWRQPLGERAQMLQDLVGALRDWQTPPIHKFITRAWEAGGPEIEEEGASVEVIGTAVAAGAEDVLAEWGPEASGAEIAASLYERIALRIPQRYRTPGVMATIAAFIIQVSLAFYPIVHERAHDRDGARREAAQAARQETTNRLLATIVERLSQGAELVPVRMRLVERTTRVYARPRARAAVVCLAHAGQVVVIEQVHREWVRVHFHDAAGAVREGWMRKKYLD